MHFFQCKNFFFFYYYFFIYLFINTYNYNTEVQNYFKITYNIYFLHSKNYL